MSSHPIRLALALLFLVACSTDQPSAPVGTSEQTGVDAGSVAKGEPWLEVGQEASVLVGGKGFNQAGGPLLFNHPKGLASDGTRLALADGNNNRVLLWNQTPTANTPPDIVLGQPDFDGNDPGTGAANMNWPVAVAFGGGRLLVADTYNDRVLVWHKVPTQSGTPADLIIDGVHSADQDDFSPRKDRFVWPWGVWSDGTRLVITSTAKMTNGGIGFGGWVLIWKTFPTAGDQPADLLLTASGDMGTPRTITSDGSRLMVGDHNAKGQVSAMGNWIWSSFPDKDDAAPDFFLTEGDKGKIWMQGSITKDGGLVAVGSNLNIWKTFPTSAADKPIIRLDKKTSNLRLGDGSDVAIVDGRVYVSDYNGNRIVVFGEIPKSATAPAGFAVGAPDLNTNTLYTNAFFNNPIPVSNGKHLFVASSYDMHLHIWPQVPAKPGIDPAHSLFLIDGTAAIVLNGPNLVMTGIMGKVRMWKGLPSDGRDPDEVVHGKLGSVSFQGVRAAAMDDERFYLATKAGDLHVWKGLPKGDDAPYLTFQPQGPLKTLTAAEGYLVSGGPNVRVYEADKLSKTYKGQPILHPGFSKSLGMALVGDGHFFLVDRGYNRVYGWRKLADAIAAKDPDVIVGASGWLDRSPGTGSKGLFWPSTLAYDGKYLWVGEYKFSGRVVGYELR